MRSTLLPRTCRRALLCALLALSGCTAMSRSQQTFRWVEPVNPREGAVEAPLGAQPGVARRPAPSRAGEAPTIRSQPGASRGGPQDPGRADAPAGAGDAGEHEGRTSLEDQSPEGDEPHNTGKLSVPTIEVEEIVPQGTLELEVRAPERAAAGRLTTYHVTLRNSTREPVENLKVVCQMDEGLRFPGSDSEQLEATTPRLESGETKEWDLSLRAESAGSRCCRFRLSRSEAATGDDPIVERNICVEFVDRQFSVEVLGPARRVESGRAEFIINVGNLTTAPRERVRVNVTFDKALAPHELTEGAERTAEGLTWELGTLEEGASRQLQAEFDCVTPARRACVLVEVVSIGMESERDEACVEIAPLTGSLDVRLSDRIEPIQVGRRGVYDLVVRNVGLEAARQVAIEVLLPEELVVLSARLRQGGQDLETQYSVRDDRLVFDLVETLDPDQEITGVIEVEGLSPGRIQLKASATSSLSQVPTSTSELTIIEPSSP